MVTIGPWVINRKLEMADLSVPVLMCLSDPEMLDMRGKIFLADL